LIRKLVLSAALLTPALFFTPALLTFTLFSFAILLVRLAARVRLDFVGLSMTPFLLLN
jgi:hypothetical protein